MEKEGSVSTGDQSHKTSFLEEEKYTYTFSTPWLQLLVP